MQRIKAQIQEFKDEFENNKIEILAVVPAGTKNGTICVIDGTDDLIRLNYETYYGTDDTLVYRYEPITQEEIDEITAEQDKIKANRSKVVEGRWTKYNGEWAICADKDMSQAICNVARKDGSTTKVILDTEIGIGVYRFMKEPDHNCAFWHHQSDCSICGRSL